MPGPGKRTSPRPWDWPLAGKASGSASNQHRGIGQASTVRSIRHFSMASRTAVAPCAFHTTVAEDQVGGPIQLAAAGGSWRCGPEHLAAVGYDVRAAHAAPPA